MELHGVLSYLSTRKPTETEIQRYHAVGQLQSIELTDNLPWEPYSATFAETETAARARPSVSAVYVVISRPKPSNFGDKEEEEEYTSNPQRPYLMDERQISVASRLQTSEPIELTDEEELARRLVAAINVESEDEAGDGLDKLVDPVCDVAEENR